MGPGQPSGLLAEAALGRPNGVHQISPGVQENCETKAWTAAVLGSLRGPSFPEWAAADWLRVPSACSAGAPASRRQSNGGSAALDLPGEENLGPKSSWWDPQGFVAQQAELSHGMPVW